MHSWASEGEAGKPLMQISPLLPPLEKFRKNTLVAPPGKNPSDAHECIIRIRTKTVVCIMKAIKHIFIEYIYPSEGAN